MDCECFSVSLFLLEVQVPTIYQWIIHHSLDIALQQMLHLIHKNLESKVEAKKLFESEKSYDLMFKNCEETTEMTRDIYMNAAGITG